VTYNVLTRIKAVLINALIGLLVTVICSPSACLRIRADLTQPSSSNIHRATAWPTHNENQADKTPATVELEAPAQQAQAQQWDLHCPLEGNLKHTLRQEPGQCSSILNHGNVRSYEVGYAEAGSKQSAPKMSANYWAEMLLVSAASPGVLPAAILILPPLISVLSGSSRL
jgi:hypothetical protein